jgi:hypothetical protein
VRPRSWLIFFSSLPSRPVRNRVKAWRRLVKAGAVQFKEAVYLLPDSPAHEEFFLRLAGEITAVGGAAGYVRAGGVETVPEEDLVALFEQRTASNCRHLAESLELLEAKIEAARQQRVAGAKELRRLIARTARDWEEVRKTDFFDSAAARDLGDRVERAQAALEAIAGAAVPPRSAELGRTPAPRRATGDQPHPGVESGAIDKRAARPENWP